MKIATWNVNSVRTRLEHILNWLDNNDVDILCLQETKVDNDKFPHDAFHERGLKTYIHGQPSYNGVALISRHELSEIRYGLMEGDLQDQKRVISAKFNDVTIMNIYAPQGESLDSPKFEFKRNWYAALLETLEQNFNPNDKLLICGDFNIAQDERDVYDAQKVGTRCMFSEEEHTWIERLKKWGLKDTLRLHTDEAGLFSWWDYRQLSYQMGRGWRIDYLLVTEPLAKQSKAVDIFKKERGKPKPSDHVPVMASFE